MTFDYGHLKSVDTGTLVDLVLDATFPDYKANREVFKDGLRGYKGIGFRINAASLGKDPSSASLTLYATHGDASKQTKKVVKASFYGFNTDRIKALYEEMLPLLNKV